MKIIANAVVRPSWPPICCLAASRHPYLLRVPPSSPLVSQFYKYYPTFTFPLGCDAADQLISVRPPGGLQEAARWPPGGRQVAAGWPPDGRQLAARWPPGGRQLAARWPPDGRQMAARWPPDGRQMAARWPQGGRWQHAVSSTRISFHLTRWRPHDNVAADADDG